jgi:hypothetical protein
MLRKGAIETPARPVIVIDIYELDQVACYLQVLRKARMFHSANIEPRIRIRRLLFPYSGLLVKSQDSRGPAECTQGK